MNKLTQQAAEPSQIDQREFLVSNEQYDRLLELLDQPAKDNASLRELFAKPAPWEA